MTEKRDPRKTKPHIYRFDGRWWFSRNGLASLRAGITLNDFAAPSAQWACEFADARAKPDPVSEVRS